MRRLLLSLVPALWPAMALAQSTADVSSQGSAQSVIVDQSAAEGSRVAIDQIGNGGLLYVTQAGRSAEAEIRISGDDQTHSIVQQSAGIATLSLDSTGSRNSSDISQKVDESGRGEIALIQSGANNSAEIDQTTVAAGYNRLELSQLGDGNIARLTQDGADNRLQLTQDGNQQTADVRQMGNGLAFGLTQTGNGSAISIVQTRQ